MEFHLKFLAIFPFGQTAFCFVAAALGAISSVVATRRECNAADGAPARGDNSSGSGWATATEFGRGKGREGLSGIGDISLVEVALWQKL